MRHAAVVLGSFLGVVAACSGSSSDAVLGPPVEGGASSSGTPDGADASASSGGPGTTAECKGAADALCEYFERCLPVVVTISWPDLETCKARSALSCSIEVLSPGAASIDPGCAPAVASASCAGLLHDVSPACRTTGSLADGTVCEHDLQCRSGACVRPPGAASPCGTCTARAAENATCGNGIECDWALVCANGTCKKPSAKDEACTPGSCLSPLRCVAGSCAEPLDVGTPCTKLQGQDDPCRTTELVYCKGATPVATTGTCAAVKIANAGERCGFVQGDLVACRGDASCKGTGENQKCVTKAADGAACDDAIGPGCSEPAECVGGTCILPAADRCK